LLTDGRLLAVTRWKHSLHLLDQAHLDQTGATGRPDEAGVANRRRADESDPPRAVMIASEATSDGPWQVVADRSMLLVDEQLRIHSSVLDA